MIFILLFCDNLQLEGAVATSWYSYDVSGFTYLIRLNVHFIGPLTTARGSSGSAHLHDSATNGGPSVIYRWQGALIYVQVLVSDELWLFEYPVFGAIKHTIGRCN